MKFDEEISNGIKLNRNENKWKVILINLENNILSAIDFVWFHSLTISLGVSDIQVQ